MISKATGGFWKLFADLPDSAQRLARKNYLLWLDDRGHPSLRFKPFRHGQWSVRVGDHYRAVGYFEDADTFVWFWIGTHEAYNKL